MERALWQHHAASLYTNYFSLVLEWPTCSVEWLRGEGMREPVPDTDIRINKFLLGTCAHYGSPNFIYVADVLLPDRYHKTIFDDVEDDIFIGPSSFPRYSGWMTINRMCFVDGEVNCARSHPLQPLLAAVKTSAGTTSLYAMHHRALFPDTNAVRPDIQLKGHRKEGVALQWSEVDEHLLASGSEDMNVCYWDVEANFDDAGASGHESLAPIHVFSGHTEGVQDVSWHGTHNYIFASAGDDKRLILWDTRTCRAAQKVEVHRAEVNGCAFHPRATYQIATCSNDKTTRLWDLRSFQKPVHECIYHTELVTRVQWSDFSDTVLATCSNDRQVCIWDMARTENNPATNPAALDDSKLCPPELVFSHQAHISPVSDVTWSPHPNEEWVVASADHTNLFQVWSMKPEIHDDEVDAELLEAEPV